MLTRFKKIIWQSTLIILTGAVLGFTVNAFSKNPLPLRYQPASAAKESFWQTVTIEQVQQYAKDGSAIFIDAREPAEFEKGHLPNAINLPAAQFGDYYAKEGESLPREEIALIVYCQGEPCDQSIEILEYLVNLQYKKLYLYPGGWNEWSKNGK